MKINVYFWIIFLGMGILLLPAALGETTAERFQTAVSQYHAREFNAAAEGFEGLAKDGIRNGKLYYNIGNAYLKKGDTGRAILWYERAHLLIPDDPDLNFNLDYAGTLLQDEKASPGSPVLQVLFFWKDLFPVSMWQKLGLVTGLLFWGVCVASMKKKVFRSIPYALWAAALLFSGTALYLSHANRLHPRAVILGKAVPVRSGYSSESSELFVLHEGTTVAVLKQNKNYLKIRYTKDKIGWVHADVAGVI